MSTSVCLIGQIRVPDVTWSSFKKNVLDVFDADLILCLHVDDTTDRNNEFYKNAKHVFEYKETTGCWASSFDRMNPGWRDMVDIPGDWIGTIKEPVVRPSTGGILLFLRWFLYQNIKDLDLGDRVIVTRSDYLWTAPHPTLDLDWVWLPNGEFHGGLPDRHYVIPRIYLKHVLTIGHVENWVETRNNMVRLLNYRLKQGWGHFMYNEESFSYIRFIERGLIEKVGFFPFVMHLVDKDRNPRYPTELESSRETVTWPFTIDHTHIQNDMFVGLVKKVDGL
jgi:hypothetical protein